MRVALSDRAVESLAVAPASVRRAFEKQLVNLLRSLRHPSLRAKKYDESRDYLAGAGQSELEILLCHCGGHLYNRRC